MRRSSHTLACVVVLLLLPASSLASTPKSRMEHLSRLSFEELLLVQALRVLRPRLRRRFNISRPALLDILCRNPCLRFRRTLLG